MTQSEHDYGRGEVLETASLTITEVARVSGAEQGWLIQRVCSGVLKTSLPGQAVPEQADSWRFSDAELLRARRLLHFERVFGADPELAALTTELIEEVQHLRQELQRESYGS